MKTKTANETFTLKNKARCACGHTGGYDGSEHSPQTVLEVELPGHGKCLVEGCSCIQFTWKEWQ